MFPARLNWETFASATMFPQQCFLIMSRTIAVHVRYISLYISLPSFAKQQREMAKFCGVYETWTTPANFPYFQSGLNAVVAYVAVARF